MIFRLIFKVCLPLYVFLIIVSSIVLKKAWNAPLLIILGVLFVLSIYLDKSRTEEMRRTAGLQLALLFAFHLVSHLNWCYTLYIILICKVLLHVRGMTKSVIISLIYIAFYTFSRMVYVPFTPYNLLAIGTDVLTAILTALIVQHIINSEREKTLLQEEKKREEMEFEKEKIRIVGEMAAGMAHEIRNPLTSIKGFLQLSKSNGYSIKPWYELIFAEVNRLADMTVEYLHLSKPSVRSLQPEYLHDCLKRVISLVDSEAKVMGHRIVYEEYDPGLAISMDMDKLVQVFINLIKNAFEAMPDKGTVTIRMMQAADMAVVVVRDTGIGLKHSDRKQIFNPFYTTKENGTGLGLSICQKIVLDHGGTMDVSSLPNQGAVFTIRFPLTKVEK